MADPLARIDALVAKIASAIESVYVSLDKFDVPSSDAASRAPPRRLLFPTGTYAAGVWQPGDDLHLVCLSDDRKELFVAIVDEGLGAAPINPRALSELRASSLPRYANMYPVGTEDSEIELPLTLPVFSGLCDDGVLGGGRCYLHYCRKPVGFDLDQRRKTGIPFENRADSGLSISAAANMTSTTHLGPAKQTDVCYGTQDWALRMVCDAEEMTSDRQHLDWMNRTDLRTEFRDAYLQIRQWALSMGLIGGLVGERHAHREALGDLSSNALLGMVYNSMNTWKRSPSPRGSIVEFFFLHCCGATYESPAAHKGGKPPLQKRLFVQSQTMQLASHLSHGLGHAVWTAITTVAQRLQSGVSIDDALLVQPTDTYSTFMEKGGICITFSAESLTLDSRQRRTFTTLYYDKMLSLIDWLERSTNLHPSLIRVWPTPVRDSDTWMYTLHANPATLPTHPRDWETCTRNLINAFAYSLQTPNTRPHGLLTLSILTSPPLTVLPRPPPPPLLPSTNPALLPPTPPSLPSPGRFRTASAALSRLRWDPAHAGIAYEVGYLDRFDGLLWLPLSEWGRATEDEEFVPEHRVRTLRTVGGRRVV